MDSQGFLRCPKESYGSLRSPKESSRFPRIPKDPEGATASEGFLRLPLSQGFFRSPEDSENKGSQGGIGIPSDDKKIPTYSQHSKIFAWILENSQGFLGRVRRIPGLPPP
eukprot:8499576-Pyramimonas_sp.AAC.1